MPAVDTVDFLQSGPGASPGYSARQLREMWVDAIGEGVDNQTSYLVSFSAGLTVNVAPGAAYIRGSSTVDQGLYKAITYTQKQVTLPTQEAQPRIDCIVLQVRDQSEDSGSANDGQVTFIKGTATAGATLDNRNGAPSLSVSSPTLIVLADVLVPATGTGLSGANIRDRRPFALPGTPPVVSIQRQQVLFQNPMLSLGSARWNGGFHANRQSAMAMFLPERIPATHIRWRYLQDATNPVSTGQNWNIAVADASGRLIGQTGPTAFAGGANVATKPAAPFNPALPAGYIFDAGWYYVWGGISGIASAQQCWFLGFVVDNVNFSNGTMTPVQNLALRIASGGTTFDASNTILNMPDAFDDAGATNCLPLPQIALSVG